MSRTTIAVHEDTRDRLFHEKNPGDSYEDVIERLLDQAGPGLDEVLMSLQAPGGAEEGSA